MQTQTQIQLRLPVRHVSVNQPFGVNYVDFYKKLGYSGHNGIDFRAYDGFNCYAAHSGKVGFAGDDGTGGIAIQLIDEKNHFKTIYYHLKECLVKIGDYVQAGQNIALCDNTGQMTTGDHLHFGLKLLDDQNFNILNVNNGFGGCVNPALYFCMAYDGTPIGQKDWDKSNAYHRYYRGRPKGGYQNEVKILGILAKKRIMPTCEKINALVYGGWDLPSVQNIAMYQLWAYLKKSEYLAGERPFQEK